MYLLVYIIFHAMAGLAVAAAAAAAICFMRTICHSIAPYYINKGDRRMDV